MYSATTDATASVEKPPELSPYWESRIDHDRLWYGQLVEPDERFVAPSTGTVYRLTEIQHDGDVFTMEPCAVAETVGAGFEVPDTEDYYVDNVCDLAGALELGELVHLGDGRMRQVGDQTYLTVGGLTVAVDGSVPESNPLLERLDPPSGPTVADESVLRSVETADDTDSVTCYVDPAAVLSSNTQPTPATGTETPSIARSPLNEQDVKTRFVPVQPYSKWTFEDDQIRRWVEMHMEPGDVILNACAGKTHLTPPENGTIIRNDANPDRDADFHVDVAELAALDELDADSIDMVVMDPPWTCYQANLRYESRHVDQSGEWGNKYVDGIDVEALPFETPGPDEKSQLGHARLAKEGFDWLLANGGTYLELTHHGTAMPARLGYQRRERVVFDPLGEGKAVIGSVDKKVQQDLSQYL